MDGRDLGKIKKEGFYRGTRANRIRYLSVTLILAGSILYGVFAFTHGRRFNNYFMTNVIEWDRRYQERYERAAEIRAERLKEVRVKTTDDDDL